jgi:hypothetical protein
MIREAFQKTDPCPFIKLKNPNLRRKEHLAFAPHLLELREGVPQCSLPPTHLCNLKSCFDPKIWIRCRKILEILGLHRRIVEKALETPLERIELKGG